MLKTDNNRLNHHNGVTSSTLPSNCLQEQVQQQQLLHQLQAHTQVHMSQVHGSHLHCLKVEDALTYLDQVKLSFGNQPHIYNEFLDVMKEFKSQNIDTSGVIHRVSTLFKEHPQLIVGFNAFLPPGYKIELHANDHVSVIFPNSSTSKFQLSTGSKISSTEESGHEESVNSSNNNSLSSVSVKHNKDSEKEANEDKCLDKQVEIKSPEKSLNSSDTVNEEASQESQIDNSGSAVNNINKVKDETSDCMEDDADKVNTLNSSKAPPGKRMSLSPSLIPNKKPRKTNTRFAHVSKLGKYGTLKEFAFFDKIRKALRNQEVYENFLRCIVLYNQEVVSRDELLYLVTPFLGKFPELIKSFKDLLGYKESGNNLEIIPNKVAQQKYNRVSADLAMEIDYSSCKKCGASYRALPKNYVQPKCSGRTNLCREVLNDVWVSFPSWSEDSTFVNSRKTQFEECIYRCEDERFELDVVLETNLSAIKALEAVVKKIGRLSQEEKSKFRLDDTLGGTSAVTHQRAIRRIYGDKSTDIIEGLKKNPVVAVPLVLRRLKAKEDEWREAQKNFNKIWREQNEKFYLKSLDHQGITFKQNDIKFLRSKSLLNEIETLYEERHEQVEEGGEIPIGPHMTFTYKDKTVTNHATNLILHCVKRQNSIHKDDKERIERLLRHFIPEFFGLPHDEKLDDETEKDVESDENKNASPSKNTDGKNSNSSENLSSTSLESPKQVENEANGNNSNPQNDSNEEPIKQNDLNQEVDSQNEQSSESDNNESKTSPKKTSSSKNSYNLFFANNNWYLFFRLHHILCERLSKIHQQAILLATEEKNQKKDRKETLAIALQFKPKNGIHADDCYSVFLDMVKSLLDGNVEISQYEDMLREMFGIHAYLAFTLDKVISNLVRQLQHIVTDEVGTKYMELYEELIKNETAVGCYSTVACQMAAETAYRKKAEQIQNDENCFKLVLDVKECRLTIELLDIETDISEDPVEIRQWSEYVDDYVTGKNPTLSPSKQIKKSKGGKIFLRRNINHRWKKIAENEKHNQSRKNEERLNAASTESSESCTENQREHQVTNDNNRVEEPLCITKPSSLSPVETARQRIMEDMDILDNTECKFNVNSYKMLFVVHSESYLYKQQSLRKAHQIHSQIKERQKEKFHLWHKNWEKRFISTEMLKAYCIKYGQEKV